MPYRQCKKPGCTELVEVGGSGYCPKHSHIPEQDARRSFDDLDRKKTPEEIAFYHSRKWTEASRRHRNIEPLCRRCREKGKIVAGELVHHNPSLQELLRTGRNPYDDQYLETLCFRHHQAELRAKKD